MNKFFATELLFLSKFIGGKIRMIFHISEDKEM